MIFRQYQLGCLSMFSYLIGDPSTGRAVVVDPQRDIGQYLADAEEHGLRIERVIETHFHADFLSGHLELAEATGAVISYGQPAQPDFPIEALADGQVLSLGEVRLEILHTPGHTPESISIVVFPTADATPWAVLTGDTMFIGDVGRPDLLTSTGVTAAELAADLHRSLQTKLLTLPDATVVYPGHGAGSACGKHMSTASSSTIGEQRATNYALQPMTTERFVDVVTEGQSAPPLYFSYAADANKRQRGLLDESQQIPEITVEEAAAMAVKDGVVVLDTRSPEVFALGHLVGSINVGIDGRFAEYAGDVIRPGSSVVIVGGRADEARVRLARIGLDNVVGTVSNIDAGLVEHPELSATASRLTTMVVDEQRASDPSIQLIDVRSPSETDEGIVPGAVVVPLAQLLNHLDDFDRSAPTIFYCASGYRSSVAASMFRANGFTDVSDMLGAYPAWAAAHNL